MLAGVAAPRIAQTRHDPAGLSTTSEHGLLGVRDVGFRLDRVPAPPDLAALVERFWLVSWDLPAGRRSSVTLLPQPCVNLVLDRGAVTVAGVGRERFTYPYEGRGQVFGVKFRPGAFLPFLRQPVSRLTDRTVPVAELLGPADAALITRDLAAAAPDLDALVDTAARHLRAHWPPPDPDVARVGEIVHALLYDRTVTRVGDVSRRYGLSARTLQRLFQRYVGVGPKWVLSRYRLHEAAARLAAGTDTAVPAGALPRPGTWAAVAVDLGYFDQSHFIRDFTRAVGLTPAAYAQACARRRAPVSA
jgi:AraC-like DNA-binding protein